MANPRVLVASGNIEGVDHERLAANELLHEFVQNKIVLTENEVPQNFSTWIRGWGGECRLEFRLTARLVADRSIMVAVNGKLFEGDSEATSDLAEEKNMEALVPRGNSVPFRMDLFNSGALGGGGDSAALSLTLTNRPAEDEEVAAAGQGPIRFRFFPFNVDLAGQ